jgi:hypothetical protein
LLRFAGIQSRAPNSADAMSTSRYPINEFGIKLGTQRTLSAWYAARKRGDLKVNFLGEVKPKELDGRPCWKVQRVGYPEPEDGGVLESTFFFDKETWLQTGTILTGEEGKLIGYYYFRDIELNPTFPEETFTRAALLKK